MKATLIIAVDYIEENFRGRVAPVFIVFVAIVIYATTLLGALAQDERGRIILDFGLALIETMSLAAAVYAAATSLTRDMDTRAAYLVLTRPVSRTQYLLGRFLGIMASVLSTIALMAAIHLAVLFSKGWIWTSAYLWALLGSFLKITLAASLTLFLALFFSSTLAAVLVAAIAWTLGHFLPEIRFLIHHQSGTKLWAIKTLYYVIPNLDLLNYRDSITAPIPPLTLWLGYVCVYAGAWIAAATRLFSRKEF
ncbi:MAG: ABC transporter permease [Elusimicrobiota bacterium]